MQSNTSQDQRYQGWANYPTWAVNLWMANDHGLYIEATDMAVSVIDGFTDEGDFDRDGAVSDLASAYEQWIGDMAALDEASFRSDILAWAMGAVDWHEIAKAWIEDQA